MVPLRLSPVLRAAARTALAVTAALTPGCARDRAAEDAPASASREGRIAEVVRGRYTAGDVEAAGAWVWVAPDSTVFVMIDAQSAIQGMVQARAELWLGSEQEAALYGRSEVLPSVAEIGGYEFDDLTGDGVPDLFGFVADSAGVSYPVFFAGSRPGMTEEIAIAAAGWHFATDEEHQPQVWRDAGVPCALQLWAEAGAPDNAPPGWRYLAFLRDGRLGAPLPATPSCNAGAPGVQPDSGQP